MLGTFDRSAAPVPEGWRSDTIAIPTPPPTPDPLVGHRAADVTRLVVRAFNTATGRGPTKARAYSTPPVVTVLLKETLTPIERTLVNHGRHDAVAETRRALHRGLQDQLRAGVASVLGVPVLSVQFEHDVCLDLVAITFALDMPGL